MVRVRHIDRLPVYTTHLYLVGIPRTGAVSTTALNAEHGWVSLINVYAHRDSVVVSTHGAGNRALNGSADENSHWQQPLLEH